MAYKQDRSHKIAFNQLRQEKPMDKYYWTPTSLMAMMVGTQQKIIVPQSLCQEIVVHWVSGELDFITGLVSDGDWAPNDQIGRLDG